MCRDWEHENESKNLGIFKEISGFLESFTWDLYRITVGNATPSLEDKSGDHNTTHADYKQELVMHRDVKLFAKKFSTN